jgi:hypothetical protein
MKRAIICLLLAVLPACPGTLAILPNPLVFPNATVGGGQCGAQGSTSCTYAMVTITNNTSTTQTIKGGTASAPFWVTWGGTCNNSLGYVIPNGSSCTLELGFFPTAPRTTSNGTCSISFADGTVGTVSLVGASN